MIQKQNTLVQAWVPVTDAAGRIHMESRWFEASSPAATAHAA